MAPKTSEKTVVLEVVEDCHWYMPEEILVPVKEIVLDPDVQVVDGLTVFAVNVANVTAAAEDVNPQLPLELKTNLYQVFCEMVGVV